MQIRDDDSMEVLRGKLRDHSGKVGKTIVIYGERAVLLLEVDIQIDDVGGDMIRSQTVCDFDHSRLRRVAVTRLLIAESPERGKRRSPSQPGVRLHYLFRSGSIKNIVIQRSIHGAK